MNHRIGSKGQVVIPKEIRDRRGLVPGTDVAFSDDEDGVRIVAAVPRSSEGLRGRYRGSGMSTRLLEDRRREPR